MIRMLITVLISINLFCLAFAQDTIEGRWHLIGWEDVIMYQFVDTEVFADAGLRYTIYVNEDGEFDDLDGDNTGGTPDPYGVEGNIITIDYHFGNIVSYQMIYKCDGQVLDLYHIDYDIVAFTLFREFYDYNECLDTNPDNCIGLDEYECWYAENCEWEESGNVPEGGLCVEIETSNCSDMENQTECDEVGCEWVEDVENGWCGSFNNNSSACNNIDSCSYTTCQQECNWSGSAECESYPGCSYSYLTYSCSGTTTVPCCSGGSYQIDNSYCEEVEVLECSEMNELECSNNDCEWIVDIDYGNCSNYNNGTTCDANENCFWDLCYGGSYGSWSHCCRGGAYQIDNSSCEEVSFIPGDANGDNILNVADIVLIVDLILNSEYDEYSDINQDGILNIIDVVELVNRILDN